MLPADHNLHHHRCWPYMHKFHSWLDWASQVGGDMLDNWRTNYFFYKNRQWFEKCARNDVQIWLLEWKGSGPNAPPWGIPFLTVYSSPDSLRYNFLAIKLSEIVYSSFCLVVLWYSSTSDWARPWEMEKHGLFATFSFHFHILYVSLSATDKAESMGPRREWS